MHHLSIDLETYSSVPLAKAGAQKYIQSPDFEILLFAFSVDGAPVQIIDLARGERLPPWLVQAITSPEYIKHAYNAPFEWAASPNSWAPCHRTNGVAPCSMASTVVTRQAWTPPARPWGSPRTSKSSTPARPSSVISASPASPPSQRPAEPQPASA